MQRLILRPCQKRLHERLRRLLRLQIRKARQAYGFRPQRVAACCAVQILRPEIQQIRIRLRTRSGHHRIGAARQQTRQCRRTEDAHFLFHGVSSPFQGQRTVNTAPPPGRLAAWAVPPRFFTMSLTMLRPRPVPPAARERALSTR